MSTLLFASCYPVPMSTESVPFGTWLVNQIEKRDWNLSDLARKIDVVPNTVSRWASGVRNPSYEKCIDIAKALSAPPHPYVSAIEVITRAGYTPVETIKTRPVDPQEVSRAMLEVAERYAPMRPRDNPAVVQIRVVNAISASQGMSHDRQIDEMIDIPLWMLDGIRPQDAVVFVVTGDCLAHGDAIRYGDRVIIDTTVRDPEDGEIVAVRVNGEETLKHYYGFPDRIELRPSSEGFDPIIVHRGKGEVEIIGVYAGMLRRARRGGR